MNIFKLSWKNILAKPLNSIMSVLLFALSIGLITFLTLFNHQFKKGLENNLAGIDLVIGAGHGGRFHINGLEIAKALQADLGAVYRSL